jgi:hypothetical protein
VARGKASYALSIEGIKDEDDDGEIQEGEYG